MAALAIGVGGCAAPTLKPRSAACTLGVLIAPTVECESTPLASRALDDEAKLFAPGTGRAQIYVARRSIIGSRYLWLVLVDGSPAGTLSIDTYTT